MHGSVRSPLSRPSHPSPSFTHFLLFLGVIAFSGPSPFCTLTDSRRVGAWPPSFLFPHFPFTLFPDCNVVPRIGAGGFCLWRKKLKLGYSYPIRKRPPLASPFPLSPLVFFSHPSARSNSGVILCEGVLVQDSASRLGAASSALSVATFALECPFQRFGAFHRRVGSPDGFILRVAFFLAPS